MLEDPKHSQSAQIIAEMIASMGTKMVAIIGPDAAIGVMSESAVPVGYEVAREVGLFLRGNNAMVPAYLTHIANEVMGNYNYEVVSCTPEYTETRAYNCPCGDVAIRHEFPVICEACEKLLQGFANSVDENITVSRPKRLPWGDLYCVSTFEVKEPKDRINPQNILMLSAMKIFIGLTGKNRRTVESFSKYITAIGSRMTRVLGPNACMIPARGTEEAGKYHSILLKKEMGLGESMQDSAKIIKQVRDTLRCRVKVKPYDDHIEIITMGCPLAKACKNEEEGRFIETACTHYIKGLISETGGFPIEKEPSESCCYGVDKCRFIIKSK